MAKAKKPRWQRRKDERPAEIIAAALDVFTTRGFSATRLDDVAAKAGISKGTLYLYFRNKEDLFKAMVRETLVPNIKLAEERLADVQGDTAALLGEVLRNMVGVIVSPIGAIPKLVIAEAGNFPDLARFYVEEVVGRGLGVLGRLVACGTARGEFRAIDPATAAPVLVAPLLVLAMWKHALEPNASARVTGSFDLNRFIETYQDVILNGLRPRAAGTGD
jgi:AcrR family transcriptional regulator